MWRILGFLRLAILGLVHMLHYPAFDVYEDKIYKDRFVALKRRMICYYQICYYIYAHLIWRFFVFRCFYSC